MQIQSGLPPPDAEAKARTPGWHPGPPRRSTTTDPDSIPAIPCQQGDSRSTAIDALLGDASILGPNDIAELARWQESDTWVADLVAAEQEGAT